MNLQQSENDDDVLKNDYSEPLGAKSDIKTTLNLQKFALLNVRPFDQLLDSESSDNGNS